MPDHITTDRLILRRPLMADADVIVPLIGDLEVARWLTRVPHPYGLDDAKGFLSAVIDKGADVRLIEHDGHLVGCIGTVNELGYWLGRQYWGQGIISEACTAVIARYFADGHTDLDSGYFLGNAASRRVLEKQGFVPTSLCQKKSKATGDTHTLQRMLLTRSAWEART